MNSRASHSSWEYCVGESQWMLTALKIERAIKRSMASLPTPCKERIKEYSYLKGVMTRRTHLCNTFLQLKITYRWRREEEISGVINFQTPGHFREDESEPHGTAADCISSQEKSTDHREGKAQWSHRGLNHIKIGLCFSFQRIPCSPKVNRYFHMAIHWKENKSCHVPSTGTPIFLGHSIWSR